MSWAEPTYTHDPFSVSTWAALPRVAAASSGVTSSSQSRSLIGTIPHASIARSNDACFAGDASAFSNAASPSNSVAASSRSSFDTSTSPSRALRSALLRSTGAFARVSICWRVIPRSSSAAEPRCEHLGLLCEQRADLARRGVGHRRREVLELRRQDEHEHVAHLLLRGRVAGRAGERLDELDLEREVEVLRERVAERRLRRTRDRGVRG